MTEEQRIAFLKNAETGAITDAMNLAGVSGWMDGLLPIAPGMRICGRAFTVQYTPLADPRQESQNIFTLFDRLSPGDVVVVAGPPSGSVVGENIMYALRGKGGAGMVLDGWTRDCGVIAASGIPHFSRGACIRLATGYGITAVQVPILCGGAPVLPGDYIVGDVDGVIALPQTRVDDVLYQAELVAQVEAEMDQAIKAGRPMQEVKQISAKKKKPRA